MTDTKKPRPKSQAEILSGKDDVVVRAEQIRRDDDDITTFSVGLIDIDFAVRWYISNIIQPKVIDDGEEKAVSIVYGSPERWMSVQKDGFLRDQKGRLMIPLIMFKRNSVTKDRTLARNMDPNNPRVFYTYERTYTPRNNYDQFSVLTNAQPQREFHNVVIPDYLKLIYEVIIWTNQMDQMNKLTEAIIYAESSYWGDPEKFQFYAHAEDFAVDIINAEGEDRSVKTTFTLNLNGYIVADALQKEINQKSQKSFSMSRIVFKEEVETEGFKIPDKSRTIIGSLNSGNILTSTVSQQAVTYLLTNITKVADVVSDNYLVSGVISPAGANQEYERVGTYNGEPLYRSTISGMYDYLLFYATTLQGGSVWVLQTNLSLTPNETVVDYVYNNTITGTYTNVGSWTGTAFVQQDNTAIFLNCSMLTAPTGLPATSAVNFTFFVNGQYIVPTAIVSFSQVGSDLVLTVNTTTLGFSLDPSDEVVGIGKWS